jgi:lysophospholipase L1-like esterase
MAKRLFFEFFFSLLVILFTLGLVEIVFRILVFKEGSSYASIYQAITIPGNKPGYVSQPYLNYINSPGQRDMKRNKEINSMGIRYPREISLEKPDSTLRILFMGGSTTFGDIDDDYDVFPALIEKSLHDSITSLDPSIKYVECLNAGVHGLTSAELLTHFQFKYQYMHPDLLVLHTGFNDAFLYAQINGSIYQPDYHNMRRVFRDIVDLSSLEQELLVSRAFAYYIIHTRLGDFLKTTLEDNIFFRFTNDKIWFKPGNGVIEDSTYNAFYNNITTLVNVAAKRSIKVLLVPEVCDSTMMPSNLRAVLPEGLRLNRRFLEKIAHKDSLYFCPLPDSKFTSDLFLEDDGIHVNKYGEELKAHYIGEYIKKIITTELEKD